ATFRSLWLACPEASTRKDPRKRGPEQRRSFLDLPVGGLVGGLGGRNHNRSKAISRPPRANAPAESDLSLELCDLRMYEPLASSIINLPCEAKCCLVPFEGTRRVEI